MFLGVVRTFTAQVNKEVNKDRFSKPSASVAFD